MKMAQFNLANGANTEIFINPAHVISAHQDGDRTVITFSATSPSGTPFFYKVTETVDVVIHRLSAAACS